MGVTRTAASSPREPLRRDPAHRVVGGVCAGLGRHFGVDPMILRVAFVALATAGGMGIVLYALAWVIVPAEGSEAAAPRATGRPRLDRGRHRPGAHRGKPAADLRGLRAAVLRRDRVADRAGRRAGPRCCGASRCGRHARRGRAEKPPGARGRAPRARAGALAHRPRRRARRRRGLVFL